MLISDLEVKLISYSQWGQKHSKTNSQNTSDSTFPLNCQTIREKSWISEYLIIWWISLLLWWLRALELAWSPWLCAKCATIIWAIRFYINLLRPCQLECTPSTCKDIQRFKDISRFDFLSLLYANVPVNNVVKLLIRPLQQELVICQCIKRSYHALHSSSYPLVISSIRPFFPRMSPSLMYPATSICFPPSSPPPPFSPCSAPLAPAAARLRGALNTNLEGSECPL